MEQKREGNKTYKSGIDRYRACSKGIPMKNGWPLVSLIFSKQQGASATFTSDIIPPGWMPL